MKVLYHLLSGLAVGMLVVFIVPGSTSAAAQSCDTLTCTPAGCCTTDSKTGKICDCEKWEE